jgi:50S ribosomal protein L16 3-hydroxylase
MIQQFLGNMSPREFADSHYHKFPYACHGGAAVACGLASKEAVVRWLTQPAADVMIVRRGEQRDHASLLTPAAIVACLEEGCTLVLRHAERLDPDLAGIAAEFQRCFGGDVDVHIYWTPPGTHGFNWHFDAEDVFILQAAGAKEYELRKNTVFPWPTRDTLPADMRYEREIMPLMRCSLAAGDCLYIPAGYWHRASAISESISLAIGLMSHTRLDVLDYLRARLRGDLQWRERLPVAGAALDGDPDLRQRVRTVLAQVSADIARTLAGVEAVDDLLAWMRPDDRSAEDGLVSQRPA